MFEDNTCSIIERSTGEQLVNVQRTNNNMFPLEFSNFVKVNVVMKSQSEAMMWHQRLGHLNSQDLRLLKQQGMVIGLPNIGALETCDACVFGKQARKPFPYGRGWKATECLQLVHAYLCCPMHEELMGESKYFLLLLDDYNRMCWIYF